VVPFNRKEEGEKKKKERKIRRGGRRERGGRALHYKCPCFGSFSQEEFDKWLRQRKREKKREKK